MGDISSVSTVVLRVHLWVAPLKSPQWFSGFTYGWMDEWCCLGLGEQVDWEYNN